MTLRCLRPRGVEYFELKKIRISPRKQIFEQNLLSSYIRGPGGFDSWKKAKKSSYTAPLRRYETRKKDTQVEWKVRNSNKMYENQIEGIKLDERVTNLKKICETKKQIVFSVSRYKKLFFRIFAFFQFRETIETRRNSDLFLTVSSFAKLNKYETINLSSS